MLIRLTNDLTDIGIDSAHYKAGDIVEATPLPNFRGLVEIPIPYTTTTYYVSDAYYEKIKIVVIP